MGRRPHLHTAAFFSEEAVAWAATEVVESPSLEELKNCGDVALRDAVSGQYWWKMDD